MFCPFGPLPLTQSLRFHFPLLPNIPPYFQKFPQEFGSPLSPSFHSISTKFLVSHIGTGCTQMMSQSNKKMNFGKLREVFVHNMPRKKNLFHFLHRCHGLREMSKIPARTKVLQGRLAKAQKRRKTPDPLQISAKASFIEHGT